MAPQTQSHGLGATPVSCGTSKTGEKLAGALPSSAAPSSAHWDKSYEWKAVTLLTLGFGLVGLDRWIIAPLAPSIIGDLGITPGDMNNLIAVLGVTWGVAAVFLGQLSDRFGRKKVLIPSIVLFSLMSGFSGLASSFAIIFMMRALMGVTEGAFCPTSFAATAEASHPKRRGFNQGLQQSTFALFGLGFGPLIATQLLQFTSWRGVFWLVAIPGLILAVLLWMTIREPATITARNEAKAKGEAAPARPKRSFTEVFKHRNVPLAMLGLFCAMCGIFVLSANTPLYLTDYLKLSPTEMGIVTSAIGFGGFVGQWGLPAFSDHFGRRTMAVLGFGIGAVFLFLFIRTGANVPMLFALMFLCTAFSFGLLSLLTGPIATEAAPLGMISTAAGLIIGTGEIFGGGLALVVAGQVINSFGIQYMLWLAFGGLAVGTVVSLFLKETAPKFTKTGQGSESALDVYEDKHPEGITSAE